MLKLDQTDLKLLEILQQNAKITNAQLSKEIGLSPAPTLERVKKLETTGMDLIKTVHPHPTMSEAIMEAAAAAYGEVIHL